MCCLGDAVEGEETPVGAVDRAAGYPRHAVVDGDEDPLCVAEQLGVFFQAAGGVEGGVVVDLGFESACNGNVGGGAFCLVGEDFQGHVKAVVLHEGFAAGGVQEVVELVVCDADVGEGEVVLIVLRGAGRGRGRARRGEGWWGRCAPVWSLSSGWS